MFKSRVIDSESSVKKIAVKPKEEAERKEDENKKEVLKHTFVDVFGATTMHGLPNIIRSENVVMKAIWILLFIGGIGCSIYCK